LKQKKAATEVAAVKGSKTNTSLQAQEQLKADTITILPSSVLLLAAVSFPAVSTFLPANFTNCSISELKQMEAENLQR